MRILVYGAGVLGGTLAANLYEAGKDVTILAGGDWGREIRDNGLYVEFRYSFKRIRAKLPVIKRLEPGDVYDVIFVVMGYTELDFVTEILRNNPSKNIIFVGNNLRPGKYASALKDRFVMFAFAESAGIRDKKKIEALNIREITIGNLKESVSNEGLVKEIFRGTGYKINYLTNMEDFLLTRAVLDIPVCFACYFTNGELGKIAMNTNYLNRVIDADIEGFRALEKAGHEILPKTAADYETWKFRRKSLRLYQIMCVTYFGKTGIVEHAMTSPEEAAVLNNDLKAFFEENNAEYDAWKMLEAETNGWLIPPYNKQLQK